MASIFDNKLVKPNIGHKNDIIALQEMGILSKLRRKSISIDEDVSMTQKEKEYASTYLELPPSLLDKIAINKKRNILIVANILEQVRAGRQCIVFACSVNHSILLSTLLNLKSIKTYPIYGNMSETSRRVAIESFKKSETKVLTNYGVLTTGFDAPNIEVIVVARPTKSIVLYSQMIGRGLRGPKVGGKSNNLLIDIIDNIEGFGEESNIYDFFTGYWDN